MTARCTECNRYIHFGGRGSKLSELCHQGQCEMIYGPELTGIWRNRKGETFDKVANPEGAGYIFVKRDAE